MGELYKLDFSNGKSYIGITTKTTLHRFAGHEKAARNGLRSPLYEAWRKHGAPRCVTLALLENKDLQDAEKKAIAAFRTLAPRGYNVSLGGEASPMQHPAARAKVSSIMKAAWADQEKARRYAEGMRGNANRKGKKNSPEHNAKVSAALKGKPFTEQHKAALRAAWVLRNQRSAISSYDKMRKETGK